MSYPLDGTGISPTNAVTNEVISVKTVGTIEPKIYFLSEALFYSKYFTIIYNDISGASRTLDQGSDFVFEFKIDGVAAENPIYGALRIENQSLNGTISVSYHALGGNWKLDLFAIRSFFEDVQYSRRISYASLKPHPAIYSSDGVSEVILNSLEALQYVQGLSNDPVILVPVLRELPEKKKIIDDGSLIFNGADELIAGEAVDNNPDDGTSNPSDPGSGTIDVSALARESGGNLALVAATNAQISSSTGGAADAAWGGTGNSTVIGALKGIFTALANSVNIRGLTSARDTVRVEGGNSEAVLVRANGDTQPISAAALPLPTGAAKEAGGNLQTVATAAGAPSDAAYAGSGTASIVAALKGIYTLLSTSGAARLLSASTDSVTIQGGNTAAVVVDGSATTQPVSAAALPLPTGAATENGNLAAINAATGAQADAAWSGSGNSTVVAALKSLFNLITTLNASLGAVNVGVWTGTGNSSSNGILKAIYGKLAATLTVTVTTLPSLPTGSNAIGSVTVSNFPATQPVSLASAPLPSNAAMESGGNLADLALNTTTVVNNTFAVSSGLGTSADAAWSGTGSGTLVAVLKAAYNRMTSVQTATGAVGDTAYAGSGSGTLVAILKGLYALQAGTQVVSAAALPLPTGAATEAGNLATIAAKTSSSDTSLTSIGTSASNTATSTSAISTSTANISSKTGATTDAAYNGSNTVSLISLLKGLYTVLTTSVNVRPLTYISDSVTTVPSGTQAISATQLPTSLGQKTSVGSLPVVISSDQSPVTVQSAGGAMATDAAVVAVGDAIKQHSEFDNTVWVDDTVYPAVYYIRREVYSQQAGTYTTTWKDATGGNANPTVANLIPAGSGDGIIQQVMQVVANAGDVGYNAQDILQHVVGVNAEVTPPVVAYSFWLNMSTNTVLAGEPIVGTYDLSPTTNVQQSDASKLKATVVGTVTSAQGTPAGLGGAWPVKLTDGASAASFRQVGGVSAMNLALVDGSGNQVTSFGSPSYPDVGLPLSGTQVQFNKTVVSSKSYNMSAANTDFNVLNSLNADLVELAVSAPRDASNQAGFGFYLNTGDAGVGVYAYSNYIFKEQPGVPSLTTLSVSVKSALTTTNYLNRAEFGRSNGSDGYVIRAGRGALKLILQYSGNERVIDASTWDVPYALPANDIAQNWTFRVSFNGVGKLKVYVNDALKHTVTWDLVTAGQEGPTNLDLPIWYKSAVDIVAPETGLTLAPSALMEAYGHQVAIEGNVPLNVGELSGEEPATVVVISPAMPITIDQNTPLVVSGLDASGAPRKLRTDATGALLLSDNYTLPMADFRSTGVLYTVDTTGYQTVHMQMSGSSFNNCVVAIYWSTDGYRWTNFGLGVTISGAAQSPILNAVGNYTFPVNAKYMQVRATGYTAGSPLVTGHLSTGSSAGQVTNISHLAGNVLVAFGSTPAANLASLPFAMKDWNNVQRQLVGDINGVLYTGSTLQQGWRFGGYNTSAGVNGVITNTSTKAQSTTNPTIMAATDLGGVVRIPNTDPQSNLIVTPGQGIGSYWGMGESLEELMALQRATLHYLHHLAMAATPGQEAALPEPSELVAMFRDVYSRSQPGGALDV